MCLFVTMQPKAEEMTDDATDTGETTCVILPHLASGVPPILSDE